MALLWAQVDTDLFQLLGRWRFDNILRYLNLQAQPLSSSFPASYFKAANFRSAQDVFNFANSQAGIVDASLSFSCLSSSLQGNCLYLFLAFMLPMLIHPVTKI
jgi:hypothetical protein